MFIIFLIDSLSSIFKVSNFLFEQIENNKININDAINEIKDYAEFKNIKNIDSKLEPIKKLLLPKKEYLDEKHKLIYLEGIVDYLYGVSCVHDIRAIFEKDSDKIKSFVPVLILRFTTKDDKGNEHMFSFQTDEKGFKKLRDLLNDYDKKFTILKQSIQKTVS